MRVSHIITAGSATISYEGTTKTFTSDSNEYSKIKDLLRANDEQGLIDLLTSFKKSIESKYTDFRVEENAVFVKNEDGEERALPRTLGERLVEFAKQNLPYQPILNFWKRLQNNPSNTAVNRLFECLEANHHPLLADGRFLAWKKVNSNFRDIHSGQFDNSPGKVVSVHRNLVDENIDQTCSYGLHVASYDYACNSYGSTSQPLLEVAVDPKDVVAIPRDYNNQKMRVCSYEVIRQCESQDTSQLYGYEKPEDDEYDDEDEGDYDYDYDNDNDNEEEDDDDLDY